ncbi:MAG TPA: hypothetical protein VN081_05200 [Dongiaceae bacterium]|nr:hypothetical protein [Dongiaceae bacterium]
MTDYLHVSNGSGIPVTALVTTDRGVGSTQLIVDSVLNWPPQGIVESGTRNATTGVITDKSVFYYHLDGSIITIESYAPGYHDIGNFKDQVVILKPTSEWANKVADRLLQPALPNGGTANQILTKNSATDGDASWKDPSGNSSWVFNVVPSGAIDGTNTSYTLPASASNLILTLNGLVLQPGVGNDYTLSGSTITMLYAPPTGSTLLATYATSSTAMITGSNFPVQKVAAVGTKDGTNLVFSTPGGQAYLPGSLQVFINGLMQGLSITETTPASGVFSTDVAPLSTDEIEVSYWVAAAVTGNADTVDNINANPVPTANTLLPLDANKKLPLNILVKPTTADFVTPTLAAGWGPWDTGAIPTTTTSQWRTARYVVDAAGVVHLSGLVKNTSGANKVAGALIFTLPAGLRPGHRTRFMVTAGTTAAGGMTDGISDVDIEVDGTVNIGQGGATVTNGNWVSLNGISFVPEQ